MKIKKRNLMFGILNYVILILAGFVAIYPIIVLITKSFGESSASVLDEGQKVGGWQNYIFVLTETEFFLALKNTVIITFLTIIGVVVVTLPAAYAFSKLKFHFKNIIYYFILMALMIPTAMLIVPMIQINKALGMVNSMYSLILPLIALFGPFNLMILKNFMDELPDELMEAARVDGAQPFRAFCSIVIPLSKSSVIVTIIWTFMNTWNEFLLPLTLLRDPEHIVLTLIPPRFIGQYYGQYPKLFAASVLLILPVLLMYVFLQKYFEDGFISGAVKG